MTNTTTHDLWPVPVHRLPDGTLVMWCIAESERGISAAGLAAWCGGCRTVVGGVIDGTAGVADPDGDGVWSEWVDSEVARLARYHAAVVTPAVAA
jgi:hypothetical protein